MASNENDELSDSSFVDKNYKMLKFDDFPDDFDFFKLLVEYPPDEHLCCHCLRFVSTWFYGQFHCRYIKHKKGYGLFEECGKIAAPYGRRGPQFKCRFISTPGRMTTSGDHNCSDPDFQTKKILTADAIIQQVNTRFHFSPPITDLFVHLLTVRIINFMCGSKENLLFAYM